MRISLTSYPGPGHIQLSRVGNPLPSIHTCLEVEQMFQFNAEFKTWDSFCLSQKIIYSNVVLFKMVLALKKELIGILGEGLTPYICSQIHLGMPSYQLSE